MKYAKYHALGNDYFVLHPAQIKFELERDSIRLMCHRKYGIGSNGIIVGPIVSPSSKLGLRIYNPDGTLAGKSGNGLCIFARFLWDQGIADDTSFTVEAPGGAATCTVNRGGRQVTVEMGRVNFSSTAIPITGAPRQVINELFEIKGLLLTYCAASVGSPHCVVLWEKPTAEVARRYGPLIESDPRFPKHTNVEFMRVLDRNNIKIEIWERNVGYTLSSGSGSVAAAATAHKLGLCGPDITVHMPGGELNISFDNQFNAILTGPVIKVCEGEISDEMFSIANYGTEIPRRVA
jgi:diaminopimelate epimerase